MRKKNWLTALCFMVAMTSVTLTACNIANQEGREESSYSSESPLVSGSEEEGSEIESSEASSSDEDSSESGNEEQTKYKVTFVDEEGNILQESDVLEGDMPTAPECVTPNNTAEYTYTGAWDKEIVSVVGEVTYTWVVTATKNSYLVKFVNEAGETLKEETLEYGVVPTAPECVTPNNTAEYTYTGAWDKEIVSVVGEATYTWVVTATKNSYLVKFVNEAGETLKEETLEYGVVPTAPECVTPNNTAEYTYTGAWDKEIVSVVGEVTYTWVVTATKNSYLVKFVNEAGETLKEETLEYGVVPTAPECVTPNNTAEYTYTGAWDKEIVSVVGEATYTWVVTATKNSYLVKFVNEAGETLKEETLEYGVMPSAPEMVTPDNTAEYSYTGAWDKEVASVTGEATYTWIVTAVKNKYQVTFDGLNATEVEYGATAPAPAISKQGQALSGWLVNGENVDITTYVITGVTDFVSVWEDVPYATKESGYINAQVSDVLGEDSWYYQIGDAETPSVWTVALPKTVYANDTKTTYEWKSGDWSSVGLTESALIASNGTSRVGTLTVTNLDGELIVVLHEPGQNITKTMTITNENIINGTQSLTIFVNNGAQYRHFYLGKAVVSASDLDTFVIDNQGGKHVANKSETSIEYSLANTYGEGTITLPKMDYSQYTKVTFDWNIAGGWTFFGVSRSLRFYDNGNALGGKVTIAVASNKLAVSMTQTVDSNAPGTHTIEITDTDIISGKKSLTFSYNCQVGTQKLVLNNFTTSNEVEFTPQAVGNDGKVINGTASSKIEGGLYFDIGNGGVGRTCDVTFAVVDYSKYTTVTYNYQGSADWMGIGFSAGDLISGNGGVKIAGTITVTNNGDGTYTAVIADATTGLSKTMSISDMDVINGKKALTISVYGAAYRTFDISAPICA